MPTGATARPGPPTCAACAASCRCSASSSPTAPGTSATSVSCTGPSTSRPSAARTRSPSTRGEAALVEFKVARAPPGPTAAAVVEKLRPAPAADDPRWECRVRVVDRRRARRGHPARVAHRSRRRRGRLPGRRRSTSRSATTPSPTSSGSASPCGRRSCELELLAARLRGHAPRKWLDSLEEHVRLAQALLLRFLQAHLEDPAQIRPKDYWLRAALQLSDARHDRSHPRTGAQRRAPARPLRQESCPPSACRRCWTGPRRGSGTSTLTWAPGERRPAGPRDGAC